MTSVWPLEESFFFSFFLFLNMLGRFPQRFFTSASVFRPLGHTADREAEGEGEGGGRGRGFGALRERGHSWESQEVSWGRGTAQRYFTFGEN